MNMKTAEFVTPKHPDKICDRISDLILDECLKQDPASRVAIETMGGHGIITVTGEITTNAYINIREIVESVVGKGYGVQSNVVSQSPEISRGADIGGAGDQGIMRGYAIRETESLMPLEYHLARDLCQFIYKDNEVDGKTQITLSDGEIVAVIASFQGVSHDELESQVKQWLGEQKPIIHINPAGDWNIGGLDADTGLTGRKLCIDNYGSGFPVGGGAFSGKDATKVDRSGAYMARKIAADFLRNNPSAKKATVELAYAIGIKEPVSAEIAVIDENGKEEYFPIADYNLTPQGIIDFLDLKKPIYKKTAEWGHFGNNFKWD
jgi:S-adenosylmethionine synthetase